MSDWISVKDELPEEGREVSLKWDESHGGCEAVMERAQIEVNEDGWRWIDNWQLPLCDDDDCWPTHWMYYPEPPEVKA